MLRRCVPLALIAVLILPALARADRPFAVRFSANDTGKLVTAANTLMTCQSAEAGCTAAQNADPNFTGSGNIQLQNGNYDMARIDVDDDPATVDSSSATLPVPTGATVLFAGLYFGGQSTDAAARSRAKIRAPGRTAYTQLQTAGGTVDVTSPTDFADRYQGFVDVTDIVKVGGGGVYTVADVALTAGRNNRFGGWTLVVAYRDTTEPARNLTVFDGLQFVQLGGAPVSIPVNGFRTPPSGPVRTTLGFVGYEGELGLTGDSASLNATAISDGSNPAMNVFNSSISTGATGATGRTPSYNDQLGYDSDLIRADGVLPNNGTSGTIGSTSSNDNFSIGVITFATELYAPKVQQAKTVTDIDGGAVEPGDELEYRISGRNVGQDDATGFVVRDPLPTGLSYVPGSLRTGNANGLIARTDAADADAGAYDPGARTVIAGVGTTASSAAGGTVTGDPTSTAAGGAYDVRFRARVDAPTPAGTQLVNTATARFKAATLESSLQSASSVGVVVSAPDLTLAQVLTGELVAGQPATYALTVTNGGSAATAGPYTATVVLPDGERFVAASGAGWSCSAAGQTVTCTRAEPLAPGASAPPLRLDVAVDPGARGDLVVPASVAGGNDGVLINNATSTTATVRVPPGPPADTGTTGKQAVMDATDKGPSATDLILQCANRKLVLTDVVQRGSRVAIEGAADKAFVGQTVSIVFGAGKRVGTAVVRPDGSFAASAPVPSKALRATGKARYQAVLGAEKSLNLKLARRMLITASTVTGGKVTFTGRVVKPLARPAAPITLMRRLTCDRSVDVTTFKPRPDGTFTVTVDAPTGQAAAVYRMATRVRKTTASKKSSRTFTLPRGVNLLG